MVPGANVVTKYIPYGNRHVLRGEAFAPSASGKTTLLWYADMERADHKKSRVYAVGKEDSSESKCEIISTVREIVNAVSDDKKAIYYLEQFISMSMKLSNLG